MNIQPLYDYYKKADYIKISHAIAIISFNKKTLRIRIDDNYHRVSIQLEYPFDKLDNVQTIIDDSLYKYRERGIHPFAKINLDVNFAILNDEEIKPNKNAKPFWKFW